MVVVPAGSYQMGSPESELWRRESEGPVHEVTIAAPFALGRHEVTVSEFGRFVDETGYSAEESCRVLEKDSVAACEGMIEGLLNECVGDVNDYEIPSAVFAGRHWRNPGFRQDGSHPVTCVSWNDAQAYAAWLARVTGERYRLPSESEWEYAARAGSQAARYWEDLESESPHAPAESSNWCSNVNGVDRALANSTFFKDLVFAASEQLMRDNLKWQALIAAHKALRREDVVDAEVRYALRVARRELDRYVPTLIARREREGLWPPCNDGAVHTAPVTGHGFSANGWGLKHMLGNVSEWTEDCWNEGYAGAPADGSAWKEGDTALLSGECDKRVSRGSNWSNVPRQIRSAARLGLAPGDRLASTGFRVARTIMVATGMAPSLGATLTDRAATIGRDETIDLAKAFVDDQTLVYEARSSNADEARASVDGDVLTLTPVAEGTATVTVTARDPDGNTATQTFAVTIAESDGTDTSGTGDSGDTFRDCAECPLMVPIPPGAFTMGAPEYEPDGEPVIATSPGAFDRSSESERESGSDERPQRTVSIPAFAAGAYEVTFAEWEACVAAGGCAGYSPDDEGWGRDDCWWGSSCAAVVNRPVINVSWDDAQLYVDWLSRNTGQRYRLLTESEWEYAARAGTTTPFHTGYAITTQQANFNGRLDYPSGERNESGLFRGHTIPVGSFAPNGFGLYDMHGNAREWVQDCHGDYAAAPSDGSAVERDGCARVLRGGSWFFEPGGLRAAARSWSNSSYRRSFNGFRVARTSMVTTGAAPTIGATLSDRGAALGQDETIDLAKAFADDQTLAYEARASNADVARTSVDGDALTLAPVAEGMATVTVTARDPDGNSATQTFAVTVAGSDGTAAGGVSAADTFRDCGECPLMVLIPAGTFTMGAPESEPRSNDNERPQRTVSIPAFAAGAHEVTFAEWDACVAAGGCAGYSPDDEGWGRNDRAVIYVSWNEAQLYVDWLSRSSGQPYRLLTESEWEYAARAGTTTPYHTGETITPQQANFDGGSEPYRRQTSPVGSFAPNGFGLYDMHGNVAEWVQDCHGDYAAAPSDGSAVERDGCRRVLRGGSWSSNPAYLRAANRGGSSTDKRYYGSGFRVARTL